MAYYCRSYAMDQAMLLRDVSNQKEVRGYAFLPTSIVGV